MHLAASPGIVVVADFDARPVPGHRRDKSLCE